MLDENEDRLRLLSEIVRLEDNIDAAIKQIEDLKLGLNVATDERNLLKLEYLLKYNNSINADKIEDMLTRVYGATGYVDYKTLLERATEVMHK